MTPTVKDIARILGVAASTVARALNDSPRISAQMKRDVHEVALQIGYVPSAAAKSMRSGSSNLVGLIVPDFEFNDSAIVAKVISECFNDEGYQLVLAMSADDPQKEFNQLRSLVEARAAGVAIIMTLNPRPESLMLIKRIPFVQFIRRHPDLESDSFVFDDQRGIHDAVQHLIGLGHRRIGYIGPLESLSTGTARLRGYRDAFESAGLTVDQNLICTTPPYGHAVGRVFRDLMQAQAPTAVLSGGSRITAEMLKVINELGLSVPGDLSVVGFGEHSWSPGWGPGLTTIDLPVREMALAGGTSLTKRIKAKADDAGIDEAAYRNTLYAPRLLVRKSTRAL